MFGLSCDLLYMHVKIAIVLGVRVTLERWADTDTDTGYEYQEGAGDADGEILFDDDLVQGVLRSVFGIPVAAPYHQIVVPANVLALIDDLRYCTVLTTRSNRCSKDSLLSIVPTSIRIHSGAA